MKEHEHLLVISKNHTLDFTRYLEHIQFIELELERLGLGFKRVSFSDFHQDQNAVYSFVCCDSVARAIKRQLEVEGQGDFIDFEFADRQPNEDFAEDLGVLLHVTQRAMQNYDKKKVSERDVAVWLLHGTDNFIGDGKFLIERAHPRMRKLAEILLKHHETDKAPLYLRGAVKVLRGEI